MSEQIVNSNNWFKKLSGTQKFFLGVGLVFLIGGVGYALYNRRKQKKGEENVRNLNDSSSEKSELGIDMQITDIPLRVSAKQQPYKGNLPNGGNGCGDVKYDYDRDYYYVLCNDEWYTKSKENPFSESAKGKFKDWTKLTSNNLATEKLNRRYR